MSLVLKGIICSHAEPVNHGGYADNSSEMYYSLSVGEVGRYVHVRVRLMGSGVLWLLSVFQVPEVEYLINELHYMFASKRLLVSVYDY